MFLPVSCLGKYFRKWDCATLLKTNDFKDIVQGNLFIYFQFIYRWQILFHLIIRLAFHKQQGLSQTSSAINNIVECCYRWHQIFETAPQFVVLIKVNINQCRNAKIRRYAPNWQMTLYQNDLIKTLKIIVNPSAGKGNKGNKNR